MYFTLDADGYVLSASLFEVGIAGRELIALEPPEDFDDVWSFCYKRVGQTWVFDEAKKNRVITADKVSEARAKRNALLLETDRYMLSDYPVTTGKRAAWVAYRQALREVPEQPGFPESIVWPVPPSGG